jgi:hypothetical protein
MRTTKRCLRAVFGALTLLLAPVATLASDREPTPGAADLPIRVHGHWRVEVLDPDGAAVIVREFQNALMPHGQGQMARFLAGTASAGVIQVLVFTPAGVSCAGLGGGNCIILTEPRSTRTANQFISKNLTKSGPVSPAVLTGTIIAPGTADLTAVSTTVGECGSTTTPAACQGGALANFTQTTLPAPIPVVAGQTISVTVTLTFDTGS